ncbi:MAG: hypothetical protein CVV46_14315 [Spirochaetae bacterium HGW-Spirochaetae-2]|jgi:predicted NBD/HSP70 family sugar kinase|nr:MAG: hypothetical protein CVV46_14315 [Spirochaetae bacterium HGW-Spirochaetae-2]
MKSVSNNLDVKIANAEKIYTMLRGNGGMTKSQLVAQVGLSFASVSNICTSLADAGLVMVTENARSTGGRKAARVAFVSDNRYTLVIDLHHTQHVYLGMVDLENTIRNHTRFEVASDDSLETILTHIQQAYLELDSQGDYPLLGVCVGISAVYDPHAGVVLRSSNPVFEGVHLHRHIAELFPDQMVIVDNDANLAGLSQMMQSQRNQKNLLFIFLTQGVGLGIMINGMLYRGTNGYAGELGHIKVSEVNTRCKCGGVGCLRTVATLESIAHDLGEFDQLHAKSTSTEYAAVLARRYKLQETIVVDRVDLCARKLGEVVAELFDLFNPQEIVFGGNLGDLFPLVRNTLRQQAMELSNLARAVDLPIRYITRPTYELVLSGGGERMFHWWMQHGAWYQLGDLNTK